MEEGGQKRSVKIPFRFFSLQVVRNETVLVATRATIIAHAVRALTPATAQRWLYFRKIHFSCHT